MDDEQIDMLLNTANSIDLTILDIENSNNSTIKQFLKSIIEYAITDTDLPEWLKNIPDGR